MARGVNKAILVGNVGRDPEVRSTSTGTMVANFSVATSDSWFDKQSGKREDRTEWHNVVAWGRLAEIIDQYVKKGQQVYIEGRIQTRKWQDRDGNDRYTTEIVANDMQMLGGRGGAPSADADDFDQTAPPRPASGSSKAGGTTEDFDDDIPF